MDPAFLKLAIELSAEKMRSNEGGPFGAVIVRQRQVLSRGWNRVTSTNDPTAHAEINAIRSACESLQDFSLAGCELYSSCEPCPMCLAAIYWARLDRIYFAASCTDAAAAGFDDRNFYRELAKPVTQRSITMRQHLREEAVSVLKEWQRKEDRVDY